MNGYGLGFARLADAFLCGCVCKRETNHRTPVFNINIASMKKDLGEDMAKPSNGRMEIPAEPGRGLDPARFRDAMGRAAAAVHIVTTNGPARPAGITATSVASITDEPPMTLFCINKTSPTAARMIENVYLAPSREALAVQLFLLPDVFFSRPFRARPLLRDRS